MAGSETGLTDLMDEMDLEDVVDTGYEKDIDVEVIDGFYHQNVVFMNDKVQLFAEYWMKLYSNCCLQRDYAVALLNDGKPEEAKTVLEDWPDTTGSPNVPQLLVETHPELKRKKLSTAERECDAFSLIKQMQDNYIRGERVHIDVPNTFPEGEVSLAKYEDCIRLCENSFKTIENYVVQNAFFYGMWLNQAFEKFQQEKCMKRVLGNFDDWVNLRCRVKKTRARQLRKFYKLFFPYKKVLRCKLPFLWFVKNGGAVVDYFSSHQEVAEPWTHNIDCACGTCEL